MEKVDYDEKEYKDYTGGVYKFIDIESGGTGASTTVQALHNLGITWGEDPAPETGTPGSIYIQLLSAEEE